MESIAQLLSSLKENEKSILIVLIANALVLYLICFIGFEKFQTFLWYQQIIIPCALSICYTSTFFLLCLAFSMCIPTFGEFSDKVYNIIDSNIIWYQSIFCLNMPTITSIMHCLFSTDHCFSFILFTKYIVLISWLCFFSISRHVCDWKNHRVYTILYNLTYIIFTIAIYVYLSKYCK